MTFFVTSAIALSAVALIAFMLAIPTFLIAMFDSFSRGNSGADTACHWMVVIGYICGVLAAISWVVAGVLKVIG